MSIILKAAKFAEKAHYGQVRNHTGTPYIYHPARVAGRTSLLEGVDEAMVAAAWLHDVLEDTKVDVDRLYTEFNGRIYNLVWELTNKSKGLGLSREERKAIDREHLSTVSDDAKRIKMLDRIDNLGELPITHDNLKFVIKYLNESHQLVEVIGDADPKLSQELDEVIEKKGFQVREIERAIEERQYEIFR